MTTEMIEWMKDIKCVYFKTNLSYNPIKNIDNFNIIDVSEIPSYLKLTKNVDDGIYLYSISKDKITHCWIDFNIFNELRNNNNIKTSYDDITISVFEYHKNEWIKSKRKQKLKRIINNDRN